MKGEEMGVCPRVVVKDGLPAMAVLQAVPEDPILSQRLHLPCVRPHIVLMFCPQGILTLLLFFL